MAFFGNRLLFIQIQFSGNALDLILETGGNDTLDMFIGIIYMYVCVCVCVCLCIDCGVCVCIYIYIDCGVCI